MSDEKAPEMIRVLIADDHALFRRGVASVINQEADLQVVAEAGDGLAAIECYEKHAPDVVLVDLSMPGMSGLDVIRRLKALDPNAHLIVLTTYDTDEDIDVALSAGAQAYLLKDVVADELCKVIRDVRAGKIRVAPAVAAKLAERYQRVHLTPRELEMLRLVADGKSNKELASILHISEGTVKVHLSNLFDKLGVGSRTEAIAAGMKRGLIRPPS